MSVNLNALSEITTKAITLSNLILVNPQKDVGIRPQSAMFPNGATARQEPSFLFHYEATNDVTLESEITDHYVEDNTAVNDHIALRPEIITTHGFIGELNDIVPKALEPLKTIADKLTVISAYTPELSASAIIAYNQAVQAYAVANLARTSAVSAWSSIADGEGEKTQNKQQTAFHLFYGYWKDRTLFTVQTPWAIFQNCAIKTLRAVQTDETRMISDFEIVFKQIHFSQTIRTRASTVGQTRFNNHASQQVDQGVSKPSFTVGANTKFENAFPGAFE